MLRWRYYDAIGYKWCYCCNRDSIVMLQLHLFALYYCNDALANAIEQMLLYHLMDG